MRFENHFHSFKTTTALAIKTTFFRSENQAVSVFMGKKQPANLTELSMTLNLQAFI